MSADDEAWYRAEGERAISERRFDEAIDILRKGLNLFPSRGSLLLGLASAHNGMGDYAEACAILEPLRKSDPDLKGVLGVLAKAHLSLGRISEALSCIEAATKAPDVPTRDVLFFADMLKDHGRYDHAARLYLRATQLTPASVEAWFGLADATNRLGKTNEAVTQLERVVQIKPDFWEALSNLGHLLDDLKRIRESKAVLDRIPPENLRNADTIRKLIRMSWRPADRVKREVLEKRLQEIERDARGQSAGIAGIIAEMDGRMQEASNARAKRPGHQPHADGRFWTGEPTIVVKGCEAGFRLAKLLYKVFDKPASFNGVDRARVVRLDRKLCQDIVNALAEFLEEYPWLCFLVDGRSDPPPYKVDDIFKESGATGLMFYGGAVINAMHRQFKGGVIDRAALLRLEKAASRLSRIVEPGQEHYRAYIELTAALGF